MNNFVKGTFIFAGGAVCGFVAGSVFVIGKAIKCDRFREAAKSMVKDMVADSFDYILYGKDGRSPKETKE